RSPGRVEEARPAGWSPRHARTAPGRAGRGARPALRAGVPRLARERAVRSDLAPPRRPRPAHPPVLRARPALAAAPAREPERPGPSRAAWVWTAGSPATGRS